MIVAILDVLQELWRADAMEPAVVAG